MATLQPVPTATALRVDGRADDGLTAEHRCVAIYASYAGAVLAAKHLIETGHEADDVVIAARHLHDPLDRPWASRRLRIAQLLTACLSFVAMVVTIVLAWSAGSLVRTTLLASASALSVIVLGVSLASWSTTRRWESDVSARPALEPDHFDVLCGDEPAAARHALARWWDPRARPARRANTAGA
jgi:hypothetical protein